MGGFSLINKILEFADDILKVLISPEDAFKMVKNRGMENQGLYVFIFFSAFLGFMFGGLVASVMGGGLIVPIIFAIGLVVLGFIKLIIWAGISHLVAAVVFGGEGKFLDTLKFMGFSAVTFIIGIFAIMTLIIFKTIFTSSMLFTVMYIWLIMIGSAALNAEHKIGYGRSFLSVLGIPSLIIIGLIMIGGLL